MPQSSGKLQARHLESSLGAWPLRLGAAFEDPSYAATGSTGAPWLLQQQVGVLSFAWTSKIANIEAIWDFI